MNFSDYLAQLAEKINGIEFLNYLEKLFERLVDYLSNLLGINSMFILLAFMVLAIFLCRDTKKA